MSINTGTDTTDTVKYGDGDCYEASLNLMMERFKDDPTARLCHGQPIGRGQIRGQRFGHAWVEVGTEIASPEIPVAGFGITVYDYGNGHTNELPRILYYAMGNIDADEVLRFDYFQMVEKILHYRHYGPWDGTCPPVDEYDEDEYDDDDEEVTR